MTWMHFSSTLLLSYNWHSLQSVHAYDIDEDIKSTHTLLSFDYQVLQLLHLCLLLLKHLHFMFFVLILLNLKPLDS